MARIPAITLSNDDFGLDRLVIVSFNQLQANPEAWHALRAWCTEHGIKDTDVVPSGSIVRFAAGIEYTTYATDKETGYRIRRGGEFLKKRVVHQLDRQPAPWPPAVVELAERTRA